MMRETLEAVDLTTMTYITKKGEVVPISQMFDAEGDPTDDIQEALTATAGPNRKGKFYTLNLAEFDFSSGITIH